MKVLLLDGDGVTLKKLGYFSERFSKEFGIPLEIITPFFKKELRVCQTGKADVKEELQKYFPTWGWKKNADDFLDYWFTSDVEADEAVFEEVEKLRARGVACYLASDQEKYRATYLIDQLDLKSRLDGYFFSYNVGLQKSDPEFFKHIIRTLNVPPSDIAYLDDDQENIDVGNSVGIQARLYSTIDDLRVVV